MFLESLARTSIQGGAAILVLYLALWALPLVSPKHRLWLWRLVFVKMLLGLLPLAPLPLAILPTKAESTARAVLDAPAIFASNGPKTEVSTPVGLSASQVGGSYRGPSGYLAEQAKLSGPDPASSAVRPLPATVAALPSATTIRMAVPQAAEFALLTYVAGFLVAAGWSLRRAWRFRALLLAADPVSDSALLGKLETISGRAGLRRTPLLVRSRNVPSAFVAGPIHPVIVLPVDPHDHDDEPLIIAHEVAHLKSRDLQWNVLASTAHALFFFHPLVWLAVRAYARSMESAADQSAIRLSDASPRRYAEMLVRATVLAKPGLIPAASGLSAIGSTASMQQRIKDMKNFSTKRSILGLAVSVLLTALCLAALPAFAFVQQHNSGDIHRKPAMDAGAKRHTTNRATQQPAKAVKATAKSKTVTKGKASAAAAKPALAKIRAGEWPAAGVTTVTWWTDPSMGNVSSQVEPGASPPQTTDLNIDNVPARAAFRELFKVFGRSFSISSDVTGLISLFAHKVTFEIALRNMLGQVGATAALVDGIYQITKHRGATSFPGFVEPPTIEISGSANDTQVRVIQSDVRATLRELFKRVDVSYSISPDVQGTVTLDLRNVTLETALQNILRQVDATYRVELGVYEIFRREEFTSGLPSAPRAAPGQGASAVNGPMIDMDVKDSDVHAVLRLVFGRIPYAAHVSYTVDRAIRGTVSLKLHNVPFETALTNILRQVGANYQIVNGVYKISGKPVAPGSVFLEVSVSRESSGDLRELLNADINMADVREALQKIFAQVKVSYSISPDVQGVVTVSCRNVTLETALANILRQVSATYRVENGVYEIVPTTL